MVKTSLEKFNLDKKLAIVGSGNIMMDQSYIIDNCDLVLRFNECKNYGMNSGKKVDILCITNTGNPVDRMNSKRAIFKSPFYNLFSEVWFPREKRIHELYSHTDFTDKSKFMIMINRLSTKKIIYFSDVFNDYVFKILKNESSVPFKCPSTGFMGIIYVLSEERFVNYDKYLFGFNFTGTDWHPWELEKKIIQNFSNTRQDFHLIS